MNDLRITAGKVDENCQIMMSGRLDASNAAEAEDALFALRREHPEGNVLIDAKDLAYISSAGLRILLKLSKQESDRVHVINVSDELFEIFSVTGFSEIMSVSKAFEEIDVEGLEVVGRGASGTVYRINQEQIVKIYAQSVSLQDIERERLAARAAFIRQLPTAIPFKTVRSGACYGLVFELLNARTLTRVIADEPDRTAAYMERFVALAKQVHSVPMPTAEFPSLKETYRNTILSLGKYYNEEETERFVRLIDSIPDADTMIHGDLHTGNVMVDDNGELILIDMGGMGYGHPIFDVMAMGAVYGALLESDPDFAAQYHGCSRQQIEENWKRYIAAMFSDADETSLSRYEKKARGYTYLRNAITPGIVGSEIPEDFLRAITSFAAKRIGEEYDFLMNADDWDEWK